MESTLRGASSTRLSCRARKTCDGLAGEKRTRTVGTATPEALTVSGLVPMLGFRWPEIQPWLPFCPQPPVLLVMAQLLSRCTPSQHAPDPASISHESLTDHVMTPASSVAKPKRRAKAFALALLPMALALTACGGSSDDNSAQTPQPQPIDVDALADKVANRLEEQKEKSSFGQYAKQFGVLQDLADSKIDIFKMYDNKPWAGFRLTLSTLMNRKDFRELKAAYYDKVVPALGDSTKLTNDQMETYKSLIATVRDLATEQYHYGFLLDRTIVDSWVGYDLDETVVYGNYGVDPTKTLRAYGAFGNGLPDAKHDTASGLEPSSSKSAVEQAKLDAIYISTPALSVRANLDPKRALNAKSIERGLLTAVERKYRSLDGNPNNSGSIEGKQVWGDVDLTSLRGDVDSVEKFEDEFLNVLVGWVDKGPGHIPFAQLSFYHEHDYDIKDKSNNAIGVDFVHMEDVSFFLYYYADTEGKTRRASMGRDEFMADFDKNGKDNTWSIGGIVEGADPTDGKAYKDNYYSQSIPVMPMNQSLSYQGIMLAGSLEQNSVASTGINTYMGDANITLNLSSTKASLHNLDIVFKNIQSTNDYLAGETSTKMIAFKNIGFLTNSLGEDATEHTFFGGTNGTTNRAKGHVYGRFYGKEVGVHQAGSNYGGRNAVGGTFYSNLTDENGNKVDDRLYEGVFGATAVGAPPSAPAGADGAGSS